MQTFWVGGITSLNGIRNLESKQTGSRIGGTFSVPLSKHQSLKFSYSNGTYIRFGGNYQNVSAAWQYSWFGRKIAMPYLRPNVQLSPELEP
jgi:hypothetical protein